mgnify:CR=1
MFSDEIAEDITILDYFLVLISIQHSPYDFLFRQLYGTQATIKLLIAYSTVDAVDEFHEKLTNCIV